MKRTAAAFVLVAGLGGCASPDGSKPSSRVDAQAVRGAAPDGSVRRTTAYRPSGNGMTDPNIRQVSDDRYPPETYGPRNYSAGLALGHGGILPAPHMGPPGVVAGVGFGGPGGPGTGGPMFPNQRTQIKFIGKGGMTVHFMDPSGKFNGTTRITPSLYPFPQGSVYRVKLSDIPNLKPQNFYPTIEVYPTTEKTVEFLSHSTVPLAFTDEDFEQAKVGNLVVKVIYLPDAPFQDLAVAEEIVSTKLEAGVDPIEEAKRRGSILLVVRLGNIDLEDQSAPPVNEPAMMGGPGAGRPVMAPPPGPRSELPSRPSTTSVSARLPSDLPPVSLPPIPNR